MNENERRRKKNEKDTQLKMEINGIIELFPYIAANDKLHVFTATTTTATI